jgi:hypothetical protein
MPLGDEIVETKKYFRRVLTVDFTPLDGVPLEIRSCCPEECNFEYACPLVDKFRLWYDKLPIEDQRNFYLVRLAGTSPPQSCLENPDALEQLAESAISGNASVFKPQKEDLRGVCSSWLFEILGKPLAFFFPNAAKERSSRRKKKRNVDGTQEHTQHTRIHTRIHSRIHQPTHTDTQTSAAHQQLFFIQVICSLPPMSMACIVWPKVIT